MLVTLLAKHFITLQQQLTTAKSWQHFLINTSFWILAAALDAPLILMLMISVKSSLQYGPLRKKCLYSVLF